MPSHYLNQCWDIVNQIFSNPLQWNFNRSSNIFIQENALENVVCKVADMLSWPQYVSHIMHSFFTDTGIIHTTGPWFIIKITSNQYRKSHCGDKTVVRSSYLHNGISYTSKTTSLYRIRAQSTILHMIIEIYEFTSVMISIVAVQLIFWCRKLEYSLRTRPIPWLLMPWLIAMAGHQQLWNRLNKIQGPCIQPPVPRE